MKANHEGQFVILLLAELQRSNTLHINIYGSSLVFLSLLKFQTVTLVLYGCRIVYQHLKHIRDEGMVCK